jgi:hypothetical protein
MMTINPRRAIRYRRWDGTLTRGRWTWLAIVGNGVRLSFNDSRNRGLLTMSLGFVAGACTILYLVSLLESMMGTEEARGIVEFMKVFLNVDLRGVRRIGESRDVLWRSVFLLMIKGQLIWVLIVLARIGPGLIADDLKARALPIYFAKPVTPLTYIAGKWLVVAFFVALVTTVLNLLSLLLGILLTGGLKTVAQDVDLAVDLLLSGLGIMVIAGMLILALSSMTSDKRYVTVAWLAVCLLPLFAQSILDDALPPERTTGWLGCVALSRDVLILHDWLFDIRQGWQATPLPADAFASALAKPIRPIYPASVLGALTLGAAALCYWRVLKFSRQAANV